MLSANQIAGVLKQLFYPEQNDEIACFFAGWHKFMKI